MVNYEELDMDYFSDVVYNATGKSDTTQHELVALLGSMPEDILHVGVQYGLCDTVFRDLAYTWLEENVK